MNNRSNSRKNITDAEISEKRLQAGVTFANASCLSRRAKAMLPPQIEREAFTRLLLGSAAPFVILVAA